MRVEGLALLHLEVGGGCAEGAGCWVVLVAMVVRGQVGYRRGISAVTRERRLERLGDETTWRADEIALPPLNAV